MHIHYEIWSVEERSHYKTIYIYCMKKCLFTMFIELNCHQQITQPLLQHCTLALKFKFDEKVYLQKKFQYLIFTSKKLWATQVNSELKVMYIFKCYLISVCSNEFTPTKSSSFTHQQHLL